MNKAPNSRRVISSMAAVALLGLVVGSPAWGDWTDELVGSYTVPTELSSNPNHYGANFGLFKSSHYPQTDDKAGKYSCKRPIPGTQKKETLTIGTITGSFCDSLRKLYNNDDEHPILTLAECNEEGYEKCSCYEIQHLCRNGNKYEPCPTAIKAPPGGGAGTGKDN